MDFEGILETLKRNREQPSSEEEDVDDNRCPHDDWPLKVNSKGQKACPVCGRVWEGAIW